MGTSYLRNATKEHVIDVVIHECINADKLIDYSVVGNNLWMVHESEKYGKIIHLALLTHSEYGWGYKILSEEVHPYYYDCPIKFLDLAPEGQYSHAKWRSLVREYHNQKSSRNQLLHGLKHGDLVQLKKGITPSIVRLDRKEGRAWYATEYKNNIDSDPVDPNNAFTYRVPSKYIVSLFKEKQETVV